MLVFRMINIVIWITTGICFLQLILYIFRRIRGDNADQAYLKSFDGMTRGYTFRACFLGFILSLTIAFNPAIHDLIGIHFFNLEPIGHYSYYVLNLDDNRLYPACFEITFNGFDPIYVSDDVFSSQSNEYANVLDDYTVLENYTFTYEGNKYKVTNNYFEGTWTVLDILGLYEESTALHWYNFVILAFQCLLMVFNINRQFCIKKAINNLPKNEPDKKS